MGQLRYANCRTTISANCQSHEKWATTCGSSRKKIDGECCKFVQWFCDLGHIAAVTARCAFFARYATVREVEAEL
jgi:hypothetical protein